MLLDTCTLLWLADDQEKLSPRARALIAENAGNPFIDPADRLIVATAMATGFPILTPDPLIHAYGVTAVW